VIANMTLDGLEHIAKSAVPGRIYGNIRSKINVIRYADDCAPRRRGKEAGMVA
jgi:hypothetical protein